MGFSLLSWFSLRPRTAEQPPSGTLLVTVTIRKEDVGNRALALQVSIQKDISTFSLTFVFFKR